MNQTQQKPEIDGTSSHGRWMTIIYDNDHTPFDLVVMTVMIATQCTAEEAEIEAWEAQAYGKAPIHFASESECQHVASVLEAIGVKTSVLPEWEE